MLKLNKFVLISFIYLFTGSAQASTVTLFGNTVSYTFDSALTGLFGSAIIDGDQLVFAPIDFQATSLGGTPAIALQNIEVTVNAINPQHFINTVNYEENGAYNSFNEANLIAAGNLKTMNGASYANEAFEAGIFDLQGFSSGEWSSNALLDTTTWASNAITVQISSLLFGTSSQSGFANIQKDLAVLHVTAVPLPATIWLLGAALIGLISTTKRRQTI